VEIEPAREPERIRATPAPDLRIEEAEARAREAGLVVGVLPEQAER
jgi:hypothetical protein